MRLKELQEKIQNAKRKVQIMDLGPKEKHNLKRKRFSDKLANLLYTNT